MTLEAKFDRMRRQVMSTEEAEEFVALLADAVELVRRQVAYQTGQIEMGVPEWDWSKVLARLDSLSE